MCDARARAAPRCLEGFDLKKKNEKKKGRKFWIGKKI